MAAADGEHHRKSQPLVLLAVVFFSVMHALGSFAAHPDYANYFAPIAGSKANGHFHLLGDSSDHGQDLPRLFTVLQKHALPGEPVYLSYCGEDSPRARRIHARRLPAANIPGCQMSSEPFDFLPPNWEGDTSGALLPESAQETSLTECIHKHSEAELSEQLSGCGGTHGESATPADDGILARKQAANASRAHALAYALDQSRQLLHLLPRNRGEIAGDMLRYEAEALLLVAAALPRRSARFPALAGMHACLIVLTILFAAWLVLHRGQYAAWPIILSQGALV